MIDLTRLRRMSNLAQREEQDETRVLFGNVGRDARIKSLNSAWEKVLGYGREELKTLRLYELMPMRPTAAIVVMKRILDTSTLGPIEFSLRCKDGTHKQFLWYRRYNPEARTMFISGREMTGQEEARPELPETTRLPR